MKYLKFFSFITLIFTMVNVYANFDQFNPTIYSCKQFLEDIDNKSDMAAIAVVWANGYIAGILGAESAQILSNRNLEKDVASISQICIHSDQAPNTFLEALQIVLKK